MKIFLRLMICVTLLSFIVCTPDVFAANGTKGSGNGGSAGFGNGGSGGSGNGGGMVNPDYGDLVVVLRDTDGVPILTDDYSCLIPLDINENEIPLDQECEVLVGYEDDVVEVEFGRLNMARAPEKVRQQALDEVIQAIKDCQKVTLDPAGRLALKYRFTDQDGDVVVWKTIDSARENLALYAQLMKFGHLQTACNEIASDHGGETKYRPCLDTVVDYPKFKSTVKFLLPANGKVTEEVLTAAEYLSNQDLTLASFFLAGAADKSGTITVDLIQYLNTILDIPNDTNAPNGDFVDFNNINYLRSDKFYGKILVLQPSRPGIWKEQKVNIIAWLESQDEEPIDTLASIENIEGFVQAANDSLRTILFLHNYAIPDTLWMPGMKTTNSVDVK